jgi:hypothetical protein
LENADPVTTLRFSNDGALLLTGNERASIRIWSVTLGTELAQLASMRDGAWSVIDAAGRYDAAVGAELAGLQRLIRRQSVNLSQLKEGFWDPGLLAKHLGWNPEALRPVNGIDAIEPAPRVEIDAPERGAGSARIRLWDQGGGIGTVRVRVNGKEVDLAPTQLGAADDGSAVSIDLSAAAIQSGRTNTLEATVWNEAGNLASRGTTVTWLDGGDRAAATPALYAIVIGISEFASEDLTLRFAASDARAVADVIERGASRLLGSDNVHVSLLASDAGPRPNKENIRAAFAEAERATADDVLFVYLAGHGVISGADAYAYLTADARNLYAVEPSAAVTSAELVDWIKRSKALKQVMVLDTCAAGAVEGELLAARGIPSDQIRAIERLQSRTGFQVLMGSAADRLSYEATQFGSGLLTQALMQGRQGAALRDGEYVDVSRLFQYAADEVPVLARSLGGVQQPIVAAPGGLSFDIGRLTPEDRAAITLPLARPMLLRPVFLDPAQGFDHLDLMTLVRAQLSAASAPTARGSASLPYAIYLDADELTGAIRLSGTYSVDAQAVVVNVNLIRDGRRVFGFDVSGDRADPRALAVAIASEAQAAIVGLRD